jgi:uncharacterized protein involved in exopolysaccharide biosynthesis
MNKENKTEKEQIIAFLLICLKNWYYFAISMAICVTLAVIYIKVKTPVWKIAAKVSLTDDDSLMGSGGISQSKSLMSAFGMGGGKQNVEDESNKMASHGYIKKVIKNLDLNKVYTLSKNFGITKKPLYDKSPVIISAEPFLADTLTGIAEFTIDVKDQVTNVKLKYNKKIIGKYEINTFPYVMETAIGKFTLLKSNYYDNCEKPCKIKAIFTSYDFMAQSYMEILEIDFEKKNSDIINLNLNHENVVMAKQLLNEVIEVYNAKWQERKDIISDKTADFIDQRLLTVEKELKLIDGSIELFKDKNNLTDIEADVTYYFKMNAELQVLLIEAETQLKTLDIIYDFVTGEDKKYSLIPFSSTTLDPSLAELINIYNEKLMERNEWHRNSKIKTGAIQAMDEQIELQRKNLLQSLVNIQKGMKISLKELKQKEHEIDSKIGNIPFVEKEYINLKRTQKIQETIYLFLIEKREETQIKAVSLMPKLKIIDEPFSSIKPVSPNPKKMAILVLFFGGALFPLSMIYFVPYFKKYRKKREE